MLFKSEKEDIIGGIQKAAGILPAKTGAAYLRSIWFKTEGESVHILATDANIEFCGVYPALVEEAGLVGVQGRALVELVRKLPEGTITFRADEKGGSLLIEQGRRKYRLPIHDQGWFKDFAAFPNAGAVTVSGRLIGEIIDQVQFCVSDEDAMEAVSCLSLKPGQDGLIEACGLNGHQFAMRRFTHQELCDLLPPQGALVQRKYLSEIKRWLGGDEDVLVNLEKKRLYLRSSEPQETFSVPLSFYQYPDYSGFLNRVTDDGVDVLEAGRQELVDSLGRIAIFNTEANRGAMFELDGNGGEMTITCMGQDIGSATETLEIHWKGELEKISFPTKSLIEICDHFVSPVLRLRLTGAEGPAGIEGEKDEGYLVIIMPMKLATETYYSEEEV